MRQTAPTDRKSLLRAPRTQRWVGDEESVKGAAGFATPQTMTTVEDFFAKHLR